jgi:hypothetical protein
MPKYLFRLGSPRIDGSMPYLGDEIEYPFELRTGDVVILGEDLFEMIREYLPDSTRVQYWVGSVWHTVKLKDNENTCPTVFLVDYDPIQARLRDVLEEQH